MHTAFSVRKSMFSVSQDDMDVDPYAILDWGSLDRLGVVIDRPVGALGASLLTLLCISSFYDQPGTKRRRRPIYPEIYLFHAGGPWTPFFTFDFWPDHKEIFVSDEPGEMLRAINNRGITHLALPDRERRSTVHRFKEPDAARDRIKRCYAYSPAGHADGSNISITTTHIELLANHDGVLEIDEYMEGIRTFKNPIPQRLQSSDEEENRRMIELVNARVLSEVKKDHADHVAARQRIDRALGEGRLEEGYRRVSVDTALTMLT